MTPHNAPKHATVLRAERTRDKFGAELERIADARTAELVREFRKRFPRRALCVVFGMGSECVAIDGNLLYVHDRDDWRYSGPRGLSIGSDDPRGVRVLGFIAEAIADVWAICNDYRDASANDIMSNPPESAKL